MIAKFSLLASAIGLAVLGGFGTAALAQPDTGHVMQQYDRARMDEGKLSAAASQKVLADYSRCLAKARRRQVEAFLGTVPFSATAATTAKAISTDECLMEGELSFNSEALRGPLYQALYRIDFGTAAPDISTAPVIDYATASNAADPTQMALVNLRRFGDCISRNDPAAARRLTLSVVGSPDEGVAFQRLGPAMGRCVVHGDRISLKRPMLKGAIAETLYRLSVGSREANRAR